MSFLLKKAARTFDIQEFEPNLVEQNNLQIATLNGRTYNTPAATRTTPHYIVVIRQLMYRGQIIDAGIATETETRLPNVINWRYSL